MTANRNGVDEQGGLSEFVRCIFSENTLQGGPPGEERYELDLQRGGTVRDCLIAGRLLDPLQSISANRNMLNVSNLFLGEGFVPTAAPYATIGYRPPTPLPQN
jgi:hypothetical protein